MTEFTCPNCGTHDKPNKHRDFLADGDELEIVSCSDCGKELSRTTHDNHATHPFWR